MWLVYLSYVTCFTCITFALRAQAQSSGGIPRWSPSEAEDPAEGKSLASCVCDWGTTTCEKLSREELKDSIVEGR